MTRHNNHPDRRLVTPQEFQDRGKAWIAFGLLTLVVVGVLWLAEPTGIWAVVAVGFTVGGLVKIWWGAHLWRRGR
jgi:hypothetical protein